MAVLLVFGLLAVGIGGGPAAGAAPLRTPHVTSRVTSRVTPHVPPHVTAHVTARVTVRVCAHGAPYPPSARATIFASTSRPKVGERIEISGKNFCLHERIRIRFGFRVVATAVTDGTGFFDPSVIVPGPAGDIQLCAGGSSEDTGCMMLSVQTASTSGVIGTTGTGGFSSGGTAFTGTQVALLCAIAMLLLAGGIAFATAGRRRSTGSMA